MQGCKHRIFPRHDGAVDEVDEDVGGADEQDISSKIHFVHTMIMMNRPFIKLQKNTKQIV